MEVEFAIVVLAIAIVMLTGGSVSLFVLARNSPNLRGVQWLAGAFASLAVGTCLILVHGHPWLSEFAVDAALLLTFALFQTAVSRLLQEGAKAVWFAATLPIVQMFLDGLHVGGASAPKVRVISFGILVAAEAMSTAVVLWRSASERVRPPAIYVAVILALFAAFNLARSGVELLTYHQVPHFRLMLVAFVFYVCNAMGMAFGFFWMTTATLTGELEYMASTDPLTRLYNRRTFLKWCEKELLRSQRSGMPCSLLMVDLDHFKRVNDDFGHHVGDQILCAAVEQMQDSVRGIDVLCRWGGEEFAVLLPNAPLESTRLVAERVRENMQKVMLPLHVLAVDAIESFRLTASIGTATYRESEDSVVCMLQRADEALYQAKRAGRNRVLEAV